jgi:arylsulfatase A-like enzyme
MATRREFLKNAAAAGLAAVAAGGRVMQVAAAGSGQGSKPNIILFFVDDNVVETIGNGGLCPNIRKLMKTGVTFTRAYTASGVCGPARFNVLSGRYWSRSQEETARIPELRIHGGGMGGLTIEGQVVGGAKILSSDWNVGKLMQLGGYKTFYTGKVHGHMQSAGIEMPDNADKNDPWVKQESMRRKLQASGWDWAEALSAGNLTSYEREKDGGGAGRHNPEWRAKVTMDFIEKHKDEPFFCYFASNLMHMPPPWDDLNADPREACDGIVLDAAPDVMPSRESVLERVKSAGLDTTYSAGLLWLDDMIGAVVGKLEDVGVRDNTMVVFMQDNGHYLGGKSSVYEGGIEVSPSIISWPAGISEPGRECSELIQSVDLAPTFMDAAGIAKPADCVLDGASLMPLLKNPKGKPGRDSLYAELGFTRAVVTKRWKYIAFRIPPSRQLNEREKAIFDELAAFDETGIVRARNYRVGQVGDTTPYIGETMLTHPAYFDADQLYDLASDGDEQVNLAGNPEYAAVLEDMKRRMREYCVTIPGTFGEFKSEQECPAEFREMLANARREPLVPVGGIDEARERHMVEKVKDKFPRKDKLERNREHLERGWAKEAIKEWEE